MNFLAHIYLSGNNEQVKIGNFIADSVKGNSYLSYPGLVQKGIILHRAIDFYTDTHPVVKKSTHRLFKKYSHYSTVIVDILYDHFLAANWEVYSDIPLDIYVDAFYGLLNKNLDLLPEKVQAFLPFMIRDNWLLNYSSIEGIEKILYQMNVRTKGKSNMQQAVKELQEYYSDFGKEFKLFFKDLIVFSKSKLSDLDKQ
ncbi:acyl carrier protein phosphodiesterase [Zunongwangia sp. F363]|uniref:Acyl carrier protein phosphodiesterase n=1 Tax=Autumnicola tepida TaxID=3075595 RepID=A0ABU3CD52_9FLAO|nr:acyl carrier protein phosphodiesterase [Zunongwangia sp. F363]MDT0644265.1 acyl carrier protein phosphodiesterase [Zunongwangia sp. F363]